MGLFSSKPSRGGGTCPVCATSAERGAQMVKGLRDPRAEQQVYHDVGRAADRDAYFCRAAFAIQTADAGSSWSSPEKLWPSSVASLDAMRHAPLVALSAWCWVCSERKEPALFKEFRELNEAGRSILIGDPSVHCTLKSVCWMNIPSDFYGVRAVTPIHTACAPSYGIHRWHMGKAV
jgi:hypothetical protein